MRGVVLAAAALTLAGPALAQAAPAAPKTKRVCKWIETGNPLDNKRLCHEVVLAAPVPVAAAAPAEAPAPAEQPAQVAMQAPAPHR